jgi:hypothetical protein
MPAYAVQALPSEALKLSASTTAAADSPDEECRLGGLARRDSAHVSVQGPRRLRDLVAAGVQRGDARIAEEPADARAGVGEDEHL